MRVLFVRHGESVGNQRRLLQGQLDLPLTEKGIEQARRVAAALAEIRPVAAVYTSPLSRAAQTAAEVGLALGVTPEPDPDLQEHDCGEAAGLTWEEFSERFPEWAARMVEGSSGGDADRLWPGGEPVSRFRARCGRAIARIPARHPTGTVVVVAHGGPIRCALAYLLDPESADWPDHSLPNGSISEVLVEAGVARLVRVGDVSHLAPDP